MRPDASAASGGHDHTCDVRATQAGEAETSQGQVCACQLGTRGQAAEPTGFLSLLHHNPVAKTYIELHSMRITKPKLFQLPLCCLRRSHWLRWSLTVYHLLLHAELEVGENHLMRVVGSLGLDLGSLARTVHTLSH